MAARLEPVPPGGAGEYAQVRPDRFGGLKLQLDRFGQSLQWPECGHAPAGAEQFGRQIDQKFIGQPGLDQRAIEPAARFDMQLVDFASAQVFEHGRQIDLAQAVGQAGHHRAQCCQGGFLGRIPHGAVNPDWRAGFEEGSARRRLQLAVHDDALRLARRVDQAHIEPGIVGQHGAYAGQHGAGACPPGVAVGAGFGAGDPLADAVGQRGGAVQRGGDFQPHPGRFAHHAAEKADVQLTRFLRAGAGFDFDARSAQPRKALARHQRIRVGDGRDDFFDARRDQRVAARPGAAVVRAGLQRDPGGRALR